MNMNGPPPRRAEFQSPAGPRVLLLTTQVGGVGLTLTAATRVVMLDPSWTPAGDEQAIARAHRAGQKGKVVAYRLICEGLVEDAVYRLQTLKRTVGQVVDSLASESDAGIGARYFSKDEMNLLATVDEVRGGAGGRGEQGAALRTLEVLEQVHGKEAVQAELSSFEHEWAHCEHVLACANAGALARGKGSGAQSAKKAHGTPVATPARKRVRKVEEELFF